MLAAPSDVTKQKGYDVSAAFVRGLAPCEGHACRWLVHIVDTNPNSLSARGWLEDTSKVQKYTMSDDDYKARENTYWRFKEEKLKVHALAFIMLQICDLGPSFSLQ